MSAPNLEKAQYDARKQFLEDLKILSKDEYEEIFRILRRHNLEYSENSNGVFFDLTLVPEEAFLSLQAFMEFCKKQRKSEEARVHAMDVLREENKEDTEA